MYFLFRKMLSGILACACLSLSSLSFSAAVLSGGGLLQGFTNIEVGGNYYDAQIFDGHLVYDYYNIYGTYVDPFATEALELEAAQAFLDTLTQYELETAGNNDTQVNVGCSANDCQYSMIVTHVYPNNFYGYYDIRNRTGTANDTVSGTQSSLNWAQPNNYGLYGHITQLLWVESATAVPVPAAGWLFLSGIFGLVGLRTFKD